jgi:glutaredoxin
MRRPGAGRQPAHPPDLPARVRLYTKPGCHLCDQAREVVGEVCAAQGVGWDEIDISSDFELQRRFAEQIPVVFVDGRQHDFWRVDAGRLSAALRGRPAG